MYSYMAVHSVLSLDDVLDEITAKQFVKDACDSGVAAIAPAHYPHLCRQLEILGAEVMRRAYAVGLSDHVTPKL